jgi:hypothetical protein
MFNHRIRRPASDRSGENYFFATADVTFPDGKGGIQVMVGRLDPDLFDVRAVCNDGPLDVDNWRCTPSSGPAGEKITQVTYNGTRAVAYEVTVERPDGVGLHARVVNYAEADAQAEFAGDRRDAAQPPLTMQQLLQLLLDPALTV